MHVNALTPELSSLAADAAVELDLLIVGEITDLEAVKELARCLSQTTQDSISSDTVSRRLAVDTATETVIARAFTVTGDDHATILGNLLQRTQEVARQLSSATQKADTDSLQWTRAFCLALSESASAYRQNIFNARPRHPYRR